MANVYRMTERSQTANWLAMQCALRIGGLMGVGVLSAVRQSLDTYRLCWQHGAKDVWQFRTTDALEKFVASYADAMIECVEKSWQDFHNDLQILLLTRDEALFWVTRIHRVLLAAD